MMFRAVQLELIRAHSVARLRNGPCRLPGAGV